MTKEKDPIDSNNADTPARRVAIKSSVYNADIKDKKKNSIAPRTKEKVKSAVNSKDSIISLNKKNTVEKDILGGNANKKDLISSENNLDRINLNKKEIIKNKNIDNVKSMKISKNLKVGDLSPKSAKESKLDLKSYKQNMEIRDKKISDLEDIISGISESVAEKNKNITAYEAQIKMMSATASKNEEDNRNLKEEYDAALEDLKISKSKINENCKEIASLSRMLKFCEHEISLKNEQNSWMREVISKILKLPKGWRFLTERQVSERIQRRLKRSDLFDADHYLELYPDVKEIGMDPLQHYILHGINESRSKKP